MAVNQNSEKKLGRRFNIIDVFLIVLVVLCVLGIYFRAEIAERIGLEKDLEEYKVSFKISEIRYTSAEYLQSGNAVYLDSGNILFGKIDGKCQERPAEVYIEGADGAPTKVIYPKDTYIDVFGTLKCAGLMKEDGFYLNGTYSLAPGSTVKVRTEMLNFTIIITDISK